MPQDQEKANEKENRSLPVLPVRDTVLFPHAVLPLTVGRESSVQLINSLGEDKTIVVVAQREARVDVSAADRSLYRRQSGGGSQSRENAEPEPVRVCRGPGTGSADGIYAAHALHAGASETVAETIPPKTSEVEALQRNVLTLFQQIVAGSPTLSDELSTVAMNIEEPGRLVDFIASSLPSLSTADKQDTLETTDVRVRLEKINQHLAKELEVQQLRNKIQSEVQDRVQQSAARILPARADEGHPEGTGRAGRRRSAIPKSCARKSNRAGMPDEVKKEALKELGPPGAHVADGGGLRRDAELCGVAGGAAVGENFRRRSGHSEGQGDSRHRPLRLARR